MKLLSGWLWLFFMFLFGVSLATAQENMTQIQRYFKPYVLPYHWLSDWMTDTEYQDYLNERVFFNDRFRGLNALSRGSFYRYFESLRLQQAIKRGFVRTGLRSEAFNPYHFYYQDIQGVTYWWHMLSVIYREPEVPDLTKALTRMPEMPMYNYQNFVQHPGGADTLQSVFAAMYNRNELIRKIVNENPALVDFKWDEVPDPPKGLYSGERLEPGARRRGLQVEIQRSEEIAAKQPLEKVTGYKRKWTISGSENVQFSQVYLENWVKGGQSSIALLSDLRLSAVYKQDKVEWENSIIHKIGVLSSEDIDSRINDDLVDLSSKYGLNASKKWFYSLLFSFKSQFFRGYASSDYDKETPISAFMSPGYFSIAAGMDYKTTNFTLLLSPVTSRLTVVADTALIDQTRYSIDEDKKSQFLTGGSLQNNFTWKINKDMKMTSDMNIFYDYFEKEEKVQAEWNVILDMKINVFLSTRIVSNLRYYESESSKVQAKEGLSISFSYNF